MVHLYNLSLLDGSPSYPTPVVTYRPLSISTSSPEYPRVSQELPGHAMEEREKTSEPASVVRWSEHEGEEPRLMNILPAWTFMAHTYHWRTGPLLQSCRTYQANNDPTTHLPAATASTLANVM